jgi:hypothetical protein
LAFTPHLSHAKELKKTKQAIIKDYSCNLAVEKKNSY